MPPKSQAQRRFGYAAAAGKIPGVPKKVGLEFEGHGIKGLPKVAPSDKALNMPAPKSSPRRNAKHDPGHEPLPVMHTTKHH